VINTAPNSNYEIAGEALLNMSLPGEGLAYNTIYYIGNNFYLNLAHPVTYGPFISSGKPSVIYIGAISCVYCGENRWAMTLALSRFGNFSALYNGYSAIHDADVPTLYWSPQNLSTTSNSATFGNSYKSNYINFFSAEYDSNITSGFQFPALQYPISYFAARAPNTSYLSAMEFMNSTNRFRGTPFTFWGTSLNLGAEGVVFGTPPNQTSTYLGITYMTHAQILNQLKSFNTTFAYEEYAVADAYIAEICPSINNSAAVCSLPAIQTFEKEMGLA
jgi:hypothetical protein